MLLTEFQPARKKIANSFILITLLSIDCDLLQNLKKQFCKFIYRGFLPYATLGTWEKVALAKNRISQIYILCTQ